GRRDRRAPRWRSVRRSSRPAGCSSPHHSGAWAGREVVRGCSAISTPRTAQSFIRRSKVADSGRFSSSLTAWRVTPSWPATSAWVRPACLRRARSRGLSCRGARTIWSGGVPITCATYGLPLAYARYNLLSVKASKSLRIRQPPGERPPLRQDRAGYPGESGRCVCRVPRIRRRRLAEHAPVLAGELGHAAVADFIRGP